MTIKNPLNRQGSRKNTWGRCTASTKSKRGMGYGEGGYLLPIRLEGLGSVVSPKRGSRRTPGRKCFLAYFEGHKTLLYAPICRCFEFVKQCFMSHLRQAKVGGNCPLPQRRTAPVTR